MTFEAADDLLVGPLLSHEHVTALARQVAGHVTALGDLDLAAADRADIEDAVLWALGDLHTRGQVGMLRQDVQSRVMTDGACTLGEVAAAWRQFADALEGAADAGWEPMETVTDGQTCLHRWGDERRVLRAAIDLLLSPDTETDWAAEGDQVNVGQDVLPVPDVVAGSLDDPGRKLVMKRYVDGVAEEVDLTAPLSDESIERAAQRVLAALDPGQTAGLADAGDLVRGSIDEDVLFGFQSWINATWRLDGARSTRHMAARARAQAHVIDRLSAAGWELTGPVEDGHGWSRRRADIERLTAAVAEGLAG